MKQVKPMIGNAKTMFKVMNEFKRAEKPKEQFIQEENTKVDNTVEKYNSSENTNEGPKFFI